MNKPHKIAAETGKRLNLTPLGEIYFGQAKPWQRTKIVDEVSSELGLSRHSLRAYMVSTPAYRMRSDMKEIILRTLPEAEDCFKDPRVSNPNKQLA